MKFLRIVLSIVFLLLVIFLLIAAALILFVDPNQLKPVIAEQIVKKTGYTVTTQGNFSWSFYPHFAVRVPELSLSKSRTDAPFIQLHNVKIATSLINLLFHSEQFEGTVDADNVDFLNIHATHGHIDALWQHNMLVLEPMSADLYGGHVTGVLNMQLEGTVPHWKWDATFSAVDMGSFLKDAYGVGAMLIQGRGQARLQGTSEGITKNDIVSRLNGAVAFTIDQGSIVPVSNLNNLLQEVQTGLNGKNKQSSVTVFDQFTGSALISHGIATCNNIHITAPLYLINGQGTLNLLNQLLNVNLRVNSQPHSTFTWDFLVNIGGPISQPKIDVSIKTLRASISKQKIKKAKETIREQILKHLSGPDRDKLQRWLGQ